MDKKKMGKFGKGVLTAVFCVAAGLGIGVGSTSLTEHYGTDNVGATRTLEDAGLTPKNVGGYAWYQCSKEFYATEFSAVNKDGKTVQGAVCKGFLSDSSVIRYR